MKLVGVEPVRTVGVWVRITGGDIGARVRALLEMTLERECVQFSGTRVRAPTWYLKKTPTQSHQLITVERVHSNMPPDAERALREMVRGCIMRLLQMEMQLESLDLRRVRWLLEDYEHLDQCVASLYAREENFVRTVRSTADRVVKRGYRRG